MGVKRKFNQPGERKKPALKRQNATVSMANPKHLSLPRAELKNFDQTSTITPAAGAATWSIQNLNTITQDTTSSGRIGRKILMKKVNLRWFITVTGAAGSGGVGRVKVVYDKQTNGVQPLVTDVLNINNGLSHNNLFNSERFITIMDFNMKAVSVNETASTSGKKNKTINLDTMFLGVGGAIADVGTGGLFILFSQQVQSVATQIALSYSCRVRYTDS